MEQLLYQGFLCLAGSCSFLIPLPFSLIVLNSDRTRMGQENEGDRGDSLIPGRGSKIVLAAHHNQKIWGKKKSSISYGISTQ